MRVNSYKMLLDEDKPFLVRERGVNIPEIDRLDNPEKVRNLLVELFQADRLAEEHVWILALNTRCDLLGVFEISHGTVNGSQISPREVFVRLCLCGAYSFVLAHNHPSGDPTPSKEDYLVTERMKQAGELMSVKLLDHIVIGSNTFSSICNE